MAYGKVNVSGVPVIYSFVVAAAFANLPSVAKEDTIGIITSLSVNKVDVCNDLPTTGVSTGDVRIKLGSIADQYINILAKPFVQGYPICVYRFNGSSWDGVEAYVRRNATWKILRTDLYRAGVVGIIGSLIGYRYRTSEGSYALNSSDFMVQVGNIETTAFVCFYSGNSIDITNYKKIVVTYTRTQSASDAYRKSRIFLNPTVLLGTNSSFSEGVGSADLPISNGNTIEFNVTAITGLQRVHVATGKSANYTVDTLNVTHIYAQ